jgi:hypothetical protein
MTPILTVTGPERSMVEGTQYRSPYDSSHNQRPVIVEPDEVRRTRPNDRPDPAIVAIANPPFGFDSLRHAPNELIRIVCIQSAPAGLPIDRVELDQWRIKSVG